MESISGQREVGNKTNPDPTLTDDDLEPNKPSKPPKYQEFPKSSPDAAPPPYMNINWPTKTDCSSQMAKPPQWNEYPTVFMSPENKGFE